MISSEALEVVREFCDLATAEDFAGLADTLDPAVVWLGTRGGLDEKRIVRGPGAVLEYIGEIRDPWEHWELEAERFIDAGDTVVVFWCETARTRQGDLELQNETAAMFKVRQGKIVEMRGYLDRAEALEAAGVTDRPQ